MSSTTRCRVSPRLEVGIGAHDRGSQHADARWRHHPPSRFQRVVTIVEEHRPWEAPPHPFNRLARERLLRWQLVSEPSTIGAVTLDPVAPPVPRLNLKDPVPCVAAGRDETGASVVAICSVGVDLDLIPFAADARLAVAADGDHDRRLVVVAPPHDRVQVTEQLAGLLRRPCELAAHG